MSFLAMGRTDDWSQRPMRYLDLPAEEINPPNAAVNDEKLDELLEGMQENGWVGRRLLVRFCDVPQMDCNWSIVSLGKEASNYFQPLRSTASSVRSCGGLAPTTLVLAMPAYHHRSLPSRVDYGRLDCVHEII